MNDKKVWDKMTDLKLIYNYKDISEYRLSFNEFANVSIIDGYNKELCISYNFSWVD